MSTRGPWDIPDPQPPTPAPRRLASPIRRSGWALLGLIVGLGLMLFALSQLFPGQVDAKDDWAGIAGGLGFAVLIGARLLSGRLATGTGKHLAIWAGVVLALVLGYSFRGDLEGLFQRVRSELVPSYPVQASGGEMVIARDRDGGFVVMADVNGQPVRFLVDTGASDLVLSPADAQRLGVDLSSLTFGKPVETANGLGYGAPFTAATLQVGSIALTQVPMSVNKAPMSTSLLGMAFFNRMKSFRVEGDRLYIRPR
jgi:aspartyl protease family protein